MLQEFLVLLCVDLYGLTTLKADGEVLDELSVIGQGLGRVDDAFSLALLGGDKAFLCGNVGVKIDALEGGISATLELAQFHHANTEVGSVGATVFQGLNAQGIQIVATLTQILVVLLPGLNGIVVYTGSGENGLPQLLDGLCLAELGEQLLGPCGTGNSGDAPLIFVLHLFAVGLNDLVASLGGLGHLLLIDTLESVGILGYQVNTAGQLIGHVLPACFLVVVHVGKGLVGTPAIGQLGQGLIVPIHNDLLCAGTVAFLYYHVYEFGLIQIGVDKDLLALLYIDAYGCDQLCILLENSFLHNRAS